MRLRLNIWLVEEMLQVEAFLKCYFTACSNTLSVDVMFNRSIVKHVMLCISVIDFSQKCERAGTIVILAPKVGVSVSKNICDGSMVEHVWRHACNRLLSGTSMHPAYTAQD